MAQHIILAAQLIPQYKSIGRCNNYVVLHSIPCSPKCKIVGLILLDYCLSHELTATAHVPAVYLQQLWQTVSKKKESIQYPRFIKLIIADLMKKFPNIPKRLEEDYHSIKDDVPLVSVYTTGNVLVRGILIPDALLTVEIRETNDFKEYETVFIKLAVPMNQPQPVVSTEGTNRNTPRAPSMPTISASPREPKKRKQTAGESSSRRITIKRKKQSTPSIPPPGDDRERDAIAEATLLSLQENCHEDKIDKLVDGDDDDESSTSAFTDFVLNDDGDDTGSKTIEKEKEVVEIVKETNVDDETKKKDEEVEKEKEVVEIVKETNVDDTCARCFNE
ncbi:hypothetical protein Tco_0506299 [Tanacetum coccineum]